MSDGGRSAFRCQDHYWQNIGSILHCAAVSDQQIIERVKRDGCSQQTAGSGNLQPGPLPHIREASAYLMAPQITCIAPVPIPRKNKGKMSGSILDQVADIFKSGKEKEL